MALKLIYIYIYIIYYILYIQRERDDLKIFLKPLDTKFDVLYIFQKANYIEKELESTFIETTFSNSQVTWLDL